MIGTIKHAQIGSLVLAAEDDWYKDVGARRDWHREIGAVGLKLRSMRPNFVGRTHLARSVLEGPM